MELFDALKNNALELGAQPAVIDAAGALPWAELPGLVDRIALGLVHNGLRRGKAVALLPGHSRHEMLAWLAVVRGGGVAVPVARGLGADAIREMVSRSRAQMLIYDESKADIAKWLRREQEFRALVCIGGDGGGEAVRWEALERTATDGAKFPVLDENAVVLHNYGLDAAGELRAGMGTLAGVWGCAGIQIRALKLRPCTRHLSLFPSGMSSHEVSARVVRLGGTMLYPRSLHPRDVCAMARDHGADCLSALSWYYQVLLDWLRQSGEKLDSVRICEARGRLSAALAAAAREMLGQGLVHTWGTVETLGAVLGDVPSGFGAPPEPAQAYHGFNARIVGGNGHPVEGDAPGELHLSGYSLGKKALASGGNEELALDADGWLRTGFLARCCEGAGLEILGTRFDVVLKGKTLVYPRLAAAALEQMPGVYEAEGCIIPEGPGRMTVVVAAVAVAGASALEMMEYLSVNLHPAQMPDDVVVIEKMPRHPDGRTDDAALRRLLAKKLG